MHATPENNEEQELLFEHHSLRADKNQTITRIDKFLVNRLGNHSRSKIQSTAEAGNLLVNGSPVKSNYKVKPGDDISIVMAYPPREVEIIPQDIPLDIAYEDEEIMIINKKAGMVVHPGYGNYAGTLVNALAYHLKDLPAFRDGTVRPGLVHRLDKNTSGIMVVAKTEFSLHHLANQFFERKTRRKYIALVWGNLKNDTGTISGHIGRSLKDRKKMAVFPGGDQGKHAVTHYRVLERFDYVTLVECELETGRTHQVRVHFSHIKHPLFNDDSYGGDKILKGTTFSKYRQFVQNCFQLLARHALHAKSLTFIHPVKGRELFFDSALPEDMQGAIDKWRHYIQSR